METLNNRYNTATLASGLRVIHLPSASPVVYCGYQINAGSRNEMPGEEGLAHFCEHVTFKGTQRRRSWQIIKALESVGGELNAFTNKEDTVFYAALENQHLDRAIDVLTDIVFCSTYPQTEIDKEVDVICDEIESYNDSPAELIYDDFENLIFPNHPLGHNILGTEETVRSFTTEDALRFTHKYYTPKNAIFFIQSPTDFNKIISKLNKAQARIAIPTAPEEEPSSTPINISPLPSEVTKSDDGETTGTALILNKSTHQAHVMLGRQSYDVHNPKRIALYLLNNILGGPGMSARLNMQLREKNGLVYTVESTMVSYGDTGMWSIYFGCDHKDVNRCLRLVRHELDVLMQKPLTDRQLQTAKDQIKGQIALACDNRENFTLDFGKSFLHYGWEKDVSALYAKIDRLTAQDLQMVAQEIFNKDNIQTLIYK